jgi:hypothetical protein
MKVVRLTESDLTRIIKRVLLETDVTSAKLSDTDLKDKKVIFIEETGLISRTRQFKIKSSENIILSPKNLETVKLNLDNGKQLTYNCEGAFVDLNEKVIGSDEDKVTIAKKAFAGWKKYTKWKNSILQDIIESRNYCGRNSSTEPTQIPTGIIGSL